MAHIKEFDADLNGSILAEEANHPRDSVLQAIKLIRPKELEKGSVIKSTVSSRPNWLARESALNFLQTSKRYQRGQPQAKYPKLGPPLGALQEVKSLLSA